MEMYSYWAPQQQRDLFGIRLNGEKELVVRARWQKSKEEAIRAYKSRSWCSWSMPYSVDKIFTTYLGPTFTHDSPEPKCECKVLFWTQGHEKHCKYITWKQKK